MTKQLQFRRGTTAENDEFTGAEGEVVVDTVNNTLRVHNGIKEGGYEIAKKDDLTTLSNNTVHLSESETIIGNKTFKNASILFETTDDTSYAGKATKNNDNNLIIGLQNSGNTNWQNYIEFDTDKTTKIVSDNINLVSNNVTTTTQQDGDNSDKVATTAYVQQALTTMLSNVYPIGSIYIGVQQICPLTLLIPGSVWTLVYDNRVLQCSSSTRAAGTTVAAGLPNLTGSIWNDGSNDEGPLPGKAGANGVFAVTRAGNNNGASGNSPTGAYNFDFNAARVNSIYGNSNTVQPPAYIVNVWRRTA